MELNEIFALITTMVSIVIAFMVYRLTIRTHLSTKGNQDLTVYKTYIYEGYIEGGFSPEFKLKAGKDEDCGYREARSKALKSYIADPYTWNQNASIENSNLGDGWSWENQISYHTADSLQNLGLSVISGSVPAALVLVSVGDAIIDDWLICYGWIESYKNKESVHPLKAAKSIGFTTFHRRHAEWIVLYAVLWLKKNWKYQNTDMVIDLYSQSSNGLEAIKQRFVDICLQDQFLINPLMRKDVKTLTGIDIPVRGKST